MAAEGEKRDESVVAKELHEVRVKLRAALETVAAEATRVQLRAQNAVGDIKNGRPSYHGPVQLQAVIDAASKIAEYESGVQRLLAELGGLR